VTVFACQSSDHNIEKVRGKQNIERTPFFKQNRFFFPVFFLEGAVFFSEYAANR